MDVARYLDCVILFGPDFDANIPWAARILETEGISGGRKMDLIDEHYLLRC